MDEECESLGESPYIYIYGMYYRQDVCRYYFYLHTDEDLLGCLKFNYWDIDLYYPGKRPETVRGSRRKFRSQTSDNMDRWKAEQGRGREKRKIRREKIREEKESEMRKR